MTDTAALGAAAFLGKLIKNGNKKSFSPFFMEIQCPNCGYKTSSTDPFFIESWIELIPKKKLLCPLCNTPMKFVRASLKMNGGGSASSSFSQGIASPAASSPYDSEVKQ